MLSRLTMPSPVGPLRLYASDQELVGLYMRDQEEPAAVERRTDLLARAAGQLEEYFAGTRRAFDLPLGLHGTEFQVRVWRALTRIAFAETWSYGELARTIGRPSASRAVGAANGRNPISIIVPCHRVIGTSGELTGYGGGLPRKRWLLDHEARAAGCDPARPRQGVLL